MAKELCALGSFLASSEAKNLKFLNNILFSFFFQVFILHIYLTLKVAMVTENGRKYRLKQRTCHLGHNLEVLQTVVIKN